MQGSGSVENHTRHMAQNQEVPAGASLVDSIRAKFENLPSLSNECCIYKVPKRLRRLNPDAYTPRVVSIGPLNHNVKQLRAMEDHKLRYLNCLIPKTYLSLEGMVDVARTWEAKARLYYADDIKIGSDDFVKMLIVDAGFLVELLLRSPEEVDDSMQDRIYGKQKMIVDVNHDIMLLENQLPYFVVKEMFGLVRGCGRPLSPIIHEHFKKFWMSIPKYSPCISDIKTRHFVDLLRSTYLPSDCVVRGSTNIKMTDSTHLSISRGSTNMTMIGSTHLSVPGESTKVKVIDFTLSAKQIRDAGVKLKPADSLIAPLNITFAKGVLMIPQIRISDITEALYRNIILYEQCHRLESYFSDYMIFLSCFVKSPKNAELFIDDAIIVNRRGNAKDISKLFDRVLKETTQTSYSTFYYQTVYDDLQAHCNTTWYKWHAILSRDYFHNPWSGLSVVAALFLLLFTFLQSVCSILAL